jgi:hypothetical protein
MPEYPYIVAPNTLKKFVQEIPQTGVPEKLSQAELEARGYKSHNYRSIIPILKFVKFIDDSGKPTDNWVNFRDKGQSGRVMASCLRAAYGDLFKLYTNAQDKDVEALRNFFSTKTTAGQRVLDYTVSTFKTLCELADFRADPLETEAGVAVDKEGAKRAQSGIKVVPQHTDSGLTINLNIQLTLPATENAEIYDKIFAALRKNLIEART